MNTTSKIQTVRWLKFAIFSAIGLMAFFAVSVTTFADAVTSITLQDIDNNGEIDHAVIVFDGNVQLEDATDVVPDARKADFHVTDSANSNAAVTITALAEAPAGTITLTLNESTVSANNTGNILEVYYTDPGTNQVIEYASTADIAITTGDGGGALITETDGAAPVVSAGVYKDSNNDGKVDQTVLTYTENTTFTMAGADWAVSALTPGDINLAGDFAAAECSGSGTTTITCTDVGTGTINADSSETGLQSVLGSEPVWAYTTSGNVTDGITNAPSQEITLSDAAQPIAISVTLSNASNKNKIAIVYSEPIFIDLDGDGTVDAADLTGSESQTSTSVFGGMTTAGVLKRIGTFGTTAGALTQTPETNNTVAVSADGLTVTITLNSTSGSYFNSGTAEPSGTFTPPAWVGGVTGDVTAQTGATLASQKINSSHAVASTSGSGSWDVTPPSQITGFHYIALVGAGSARTEWTAHSTLADWSRYMFAYGTSTGVSLSSSLWTSSNDENLTTIGTTATVITGLTEGNVYFMKSYAVDIEGNVSTASTEMSFTLQGSTSSSDSSSSTTPPPVTPPTTTETTTTTDTTNPATETSTTTETTTTPSTRPSTVETKTGETVTVTDISNHWSKDVVQAMMKAGVIKGNKDGTFKPDGNLNRAETSALLYRVLSLVEPPLSPELKPFSDVDVTEWYAGYIAELKKRGVINGNPDGTYKPANEINRAEFLNMAMSLYTYVADEKTKAELEALKNSAPTTAYKDLDTTAWYSSTVTAATEKGFIGGKECGTDKCFDAGSNITRAEATQVLYNMFAKMLKVQLPVT